MTRSAALRWLAAGTVALGLHAGAAALMIRGHRPDPLDAGGGDAIAVELEPVEGEPAKPDEAPPAVPADETSTAAAAAEASQASPPPPPVTSPPPPAIEPPPPPPSEAAPDVPAAPPVVPPAPEPRPPEPRPLEPPRPETPPVETTRASAASAAAEDAARAVQKLAAAREAAWRGRLVPHLNRYRRFPPGVGSGTARVGFTVDGDGRVAAVSIVTGSGDAALDAAARALIERASPFPAPPAGTTGRALTFVVPVHYDARHP